MSRLFCIALRPTPIFQAYKISDKAEVCLLSQTGCLMVNGRKNLSFCMPRIKTTWLNEKMQVLHENVTALQNKVSSKSTHECRVTLKALKAWWQQQGLSTKDFKKQFIMLHKLYSKCGHLRDHEMVREKLKGLEAYDKKGKADKYLRKLIRQKKAAITRLLNQKNATHTIAAEMQQIARQRPLQIHTILPLKAIAAAQIAKDTFVWHERRKLLKRYQFMHAASQSTILPSALFVQQMQHNIGEWHDWKNVLRWLTNNKTLFKTSAYYLLQEQADLACSHQAQEIIQMQSK